MVNVVQNLAPNVFEIIFTVLVLLLICAFIGWTLRRPLLEGVAVGLLFSAVSSGLAFYISREYAFPLWLFILLTICILTLLVIGTRKAVFIKPYAGRETGFQTWIVVLGISLIILAVRLLTPHPQAGYSLFQAWNPLYLAASAEKGRFLALSDMVFGPGFLGGVTFYPVDSFGLSAFLHLITGLNIQAVVLATSISTVIVAFSILAFGLRRSPIAVFGFGIIFLVFFRYGYSFRTPIADNLIDHMTYLSGATALYYLVAGEAGRVARVGSALMLAPAVMARSAGAVYSALFALSGFLKDLKQGFLKQTIWSWVFFATVLGIMTFREIMLVLQVGVFGPRSRVMEMYPPSVSKSFWGILNDLGIMPNSSVFEFSIPMLSFSGLALLVMLYVRRKDIFTHPRLLLILTAPFLILLAPVVVEIITGFRKGGFGSKLYFVSMFFFPWYPCWLLSRMPKLRWWPDIARRTFAYSVVATLVGAIAFTALKIDYLTAKYEWALGTYRANEPDSQMVAAIHREFPDLRDFQAIVKKPVVYFYYEPGAGLRYYLGGDFFSDYDFWSDDFQKRMKNAKKFDDVLRDLNYPSLYFSYPGAIEGTSAWISSKSWEKFETEIRQIENQSYAKRIVKSGNVRFIVTGAQ